MWVLALLVLIISLPHRPLSTYTKTYNATVQTMLVAMRLIFFTQMCKMCKQCRSHLSATANWGALNQAHYFSHRLPFAHCQFANWPTICFFGLSPSLWHKLCNVWLICLDSIQSCIKYILCPLPSSSLHPLLAAVLDQSDAALVIFRLGPWRWF